MRNTLKDLKKSLDNKERVAKAAVVTTVVQTAESIIMSKFGCKVLVEVLEAYSNTKALDLALKKIRTVSLETSALLISVDRDVNKIFVLSSVTKVRPFNLECSNKSKNNCTDIENELIHSPQYAKG